MSFQNWDEEFNYNMTENEIRHKVRISKAQADIDKILKGPDAPLDVETCVKNGVITSIAPVVVPDTQEDELIRNLQADLYQSLKVNDFQAAGKAQEQMQQLHVDDCGAVLQVNHKFYQAFSEKDTEKMKRVWIADPTATCIHPGNSPLVGIKTVMEGWEKMFGATDQSFQRNWIEVTNVRLTIKGATTAIITCDEHIKVRRFIRGKKRETETINVLQATNVFVKVDDRWKVTHHHASIHADAPTPAIATSARKAGLDTRSSGLDKIGPLLGDGSEDGHGNKPKRIIVGNLNDLFSGNLGDILDSASTSSASDDGKGDNDSSHLANGDDMSGITLSFSEVIGSGAHEGDDEEEEEDDRKNSGGQDIGSRILKQLRTPGGGSDEKEHSVQGGLGNSEHDLRQECISQLRILAQQGSISPKQKRTLLTDIITCSARGEFSMVEVAFELLCREIPNDEEAQEEFAEQCRVFADRNI